MKVTRPAWIEASLEVNEGRDPLGLQTTTQDRLMPLLLPGILELSRRARYFSFEAFLLAEYQARQMPGKCQGTVDIPQTPRVGLRPRDPALPTL